MKKLRKSLLFIACLATTGTLVSCGSKEQLASPKNIMVENGVLYWTPVKNAENYILKINSNDPITVEGSAYLNLDVKEDFKVEIIAVDKDKIYDDSKSSIKEFHYTTAPKNFRHEDGILKWDKVDGANEYEIFDKSNRETYFISDTSFASYNPTKTYHEFILKVRSDKLGNIESPWSESIKFQSIEGPVIKYDYDNDCLSWSNKDEVKGYDLLINEESIKINDLSKVYKYLPTDDKEVKVKIRGISKIENRASSAYSKEITLKRTTLIIKENVNIYPRENNKVNFVIKDKTPFVQGYKVNIDGKSYRFEGKNFDIPINEGLNTAELVLESFKSKTDKTYFRLDSLPTSFTFNKLGQSKNAKLSEDKKFILFDEVKGAEEYQIYLEAGKVFKVKEPKIKVSDLLPGNYSIEVNALSSKPNYFAGEKFKFSVTKPEVPEDFSLLQNGSLKVRKKEYSKYIFNVDGKDFEVEENTINIYDFNKNSLKVKVKARSTYYGDIKLDGEYTSTFTLEKLPKVTNLMVKNMILTIDGPIGKKIGYMLVFGDLPYNYHFMQPRLDLSKIDLKNNKNIGVYATIYYGSVPLNDTNETYYFRGDVVNYKIPDSEMEGEVK